MMTPDLENTALRENGVPFNATESLLSAVAIFWLLSSFALTRSFMDQLPSRIPMHFDWAGTPNGWGSRKMAWLLPLVGAVMTVALLLAARIPNRHRLPWALTAENAARLFHLSRQLILQLLNVILVGFLYLNWVIIQVSLQAKTGLATDFLPVFMALILLPVAIFWVRGRSARGYE